MLKHACCHLKEYPGSVAYFSTTDLPEGRRAVVFVHGFNGDSIATWSDFPRFVDNEEQNDLWWTDADLYFYHYGRFSVSKGVPRNTLELQNFLDSVWPTPPPYLLPLLVEIGREHTVYDELTLVGHSMGGLLIRKVLLEAAKSDDRVQEFQRLRLSTDLVAPHPKVCCARKYDCLPPPLAAKLLPVCSAF